MYCPCGKQADYENCCGKFISQHELPTTPEELMRSRYTAYSLKNIAYIQDTMLFPANKDFDVDDTKQWAEAVKWLKLEVLYSTMQGNSGTVEFRANFMFENKNQIMHELSEFRRVNGKWFYVDGHAPTHF